MILFLSDEKSNLRKVSGKVNKLPQKKTARRTLKKIKTKAKTLSRT